MVTTEIILNRAEILPELNHVIQLRYCKIIKEDGIEIARNNWACAITPTTEEIKVSPFGVERDLDAEVVNLMKSWTAEIKKEFKEKYILVPIKK